LCVVLQSSQTSRIKQSVGKLGGAHGASGAFFIAQEFQETGYYVYRFYKASFGRQPGSKKFKH
jgi:hypothetical protein